MSRRSKLVRPLAGRNPAAGGIVGRGNVGNCVCVCVPQKDVNSFEFQKNMFLLFRVSEHVFFVLQPENVEY